MYKKILVAYDGSKTSQAALDHAAEIADQNHSLLYLVHVIKDKESDSSWTNADFPTESDEPDLPPSDYPRQDVTISNDKGTFLLNKARNNLFLPDSQIAMEVLYGDPARKLCEYAEQQGVDIIVIGNRGQHGVRKLMIGSVSQKVARHAYCPVLIVK